MTLFHHKLLKTYEGIVSSDLHHNNNHILNLSLKDTIGRVKYQSYYGTYENTETDTGTCSYVICYCFVSSFTRMEIVL